MERLFVADCHDYLVQEAKFQQTGFGIVNNNHFPNHVFPNALGYPAPK
jgi:hypothetical protein